MHFFDLVAQELMSHVAQYKGYIKRDSDDESLIHIIVEDKLVDVYFLKFDEQTPPRKTNPAATKTLKFFEDEWYNKKEVVLSLIDKALGKEKIIDFDNISFEYDPNNIIKFQKNNDIHYYSGGTEAIVAMKNDQIVAILSYFVDASLVSDLRIVRDIHVTSYCELNGHRVKDAMVHMVDTAIISNEANDIVMHTDNRIFSGTVWKKYGFAVSRVNEPLSWILRSGERHPQYLTVSGAKYYSSALPILNRENSSSHVLYDDGSTVWKCNIGKRARYYP